MPDLGGTRQPDFAHAILEACGALIVVLDGDGRIVQLNRACERLTGYASDEVRGRYAWELLVPPEEVDRARESCTELLSTGVQARREVRVRTRGGEEYLIAWTGEAVRDADGRIDWVMCTGVDVTEQRRAEKELAQFRLGIERSGEIIFLTDREGRIRYVNPAFEGVYGYTREEVLGQTPRILKSGLHGPETYEHLWSSLLARDAVSGEFINKAKDGRLLTVAASANPVTDDEGNITGFLAIQRDITEWKRTEQALRASEERLRTVLEKSPDGVGVMDFQGRILYANPAISAMLGYSHEELVGRRVADFQHPEDRPRAAGRIQELFRGGPEDPSQYRLIRRDGGILTAEITSRVIEFEGQRALLSTLRDLTERLELEEQLRQAQKLEAIGQLAGGIAHDFNNLLTVIQVCGELIGRGLDASDPALTPNLDELQAAVGRGKGLIEKLLAFSRGEELRVEPLDLRELIRDFEPTLRRLLPEHIEILLEVPQKLPNALASAGCVEQILMNLATNAGNAMPDGGRLKIALERMESSSPDAPAGQIRLTVSDTGVGMDETTRARLFEPFFTTRRASGGAGLGMAVVYGLVKQLNGSIHVSSEMGEGAAVAVDLPVAAEIAVGPAPEPASKVRGGEETILLVEDEAALRRAAKRSLEGLGYSVLVAADGQEALEVYEEHGAGPALVVSDIVMPRLGGRALYAEMRRRGIHIPFLFTSGYSAGDTEGMDELDPGVPFLAKPWTLDVLARKIRQVLDADGAG